MKPIAVISSPDPSASQRGEKSVEVSAAITLRPMTPRDIPFGLKLSRAAGWNQSADDWAMLIEHSTAGSYIACFNGVDAGTVTTILYQQQFSWIGMALVAEELRRLGIGKALTQAAIKAVKDQGTVCLDATPAGKKLYDSLGFQDVYGLSRWSRQPAPMELKTNERHPLRSEILPAILTYDIPVFGAERLGILNTILQNFPRLAFYAEQDGQVTGYCLGRIGSQSAQIGPVVADHLDIARDLFLSALQRCAHQSVIVDTPFHQTEWNRFLHDLGFEEQRPFIRMSLGEFTLPELHSKQFAIAGPEIG